MAIKIKLPITCNHDHLIHGKHPVHHVSSQAERKLGVMVEHPYSLTRDATVNERCMVLFSRKCSLYSLNHMPLSNSLCSRTVAAPQIVAALDREEYRRIPRERVKEF